MNIIAHRIGMVPEYIGKLARVKKLSLGANKITGEILV